MDQDKQTNSGVACEVSECYYHTMDDCCTAEKIEVSNCKECGNNANETFCSTYREKL